MRLEPKKLLKTKLRLLEDPKKRGIPKNIHSSDAMQSTRPPSRRSVGSAPGGGVRGAGYNAAREILKDRHLWGGPPGPRPTAGSAF
jgi:hypothetical protein